jgi:hypothetical protein
MVLNTGEKKVSSMVNKKLLQIPIELFFLVAIGAGLLSKPACASSLAVVDTLIAKQEYAAASALLSHHLDSVPADNNALYMLVAVEQTRILDYESYQIEGDSLYNTADSIKKVLTSRIPQLTGKDSVQCLFYIATIDGCMSVLQAKKGEILPALKNAIESVTMLNEVVRLDSSRYEAYMGIGLFHYYLNKSFKWLPFIDANSEMEGIVKVQQATFAQFPYDYAAKNSLSWILMERYKNKQVDSIAAGVLSIYPDNTIFLRIRCLNALWSKQYATAVSLGENLAKVTLKRLPENWSDMVLAYYVIASGNDKRGKKKEAIAAADYILGAPIPIKYREIPHIKKNIRRIQNIRKKS